MSGLVPGSFPRLVARAFEELDRNRSIFGLDARKFVVQPPRHDTTVSIHKRKAGAPLGPSAGPHTQMAQNIVLSWLAGSRVIELKTVQILDSLAIPRPCIDLHSVALNVEWSQELRIEQSLEEYVKASMLIAMLAHSFKVEPSCIFDMSVGYDLRGLRSERMVAFMQSMRHARRYVDAFRSTIPARWGHLRGLDFAADIAPGVTVSTFHGCPVSEIERIADFLMADMDLDCTIKLNPTLLGQVAVREIVHDRLGFTDIRIPSSAFRNDPTFDEAAEIVRRLQLRARELGRGFAIKLTNTLVVENRSGFLPASEKLAYLSGAPLHVVAMHLVRLFRKTFGEGLPISFSAGIDRTNYPDAVSLGLAPVTVCTDLLKQGGYARLHAYTDELQTRMDAARTPTLREFSRSGNLDAYVDSLDSDPRYCAGRTRHPSRKTGAALGPFDCATCDLCIAACPNDAIFVLPSLDGRFAFREKHQLAVQAEWCNDCGNCETFCPDVGAPNRTKLRLFIHEDDWKADAPRDAYLVHHKGTRCRIGGVEISYDSCDRDSEAFTTMHYLRHAVFDPEHVNSINCLALEER
ncbi:MAG TPA: 4Fe-4S dicluster domain-containing protein [Thermoanaerobaculia bacterium]|nr:4Fe-4S dicluster domain-containing protein [Thermoanaerobaculia bacterium]